MLKVNNIFVVYFFVEYFCFYFSFAVLFFLFVCFLVCLFVCFFDIMNDRQISLEIFAKRQRQSFANVLQSGYSWQHSQTPTRLFPVNIAKLLRIAFL